MLLEVKNLVVNYEAVRALKDVSLTVDEGEVVALVGANGAGKTTLLRAISGLKTHASGEVVFQGERLDRVRPHQIVGKGIALVPEGRLVFGPMTVLDNLKMGAYWRRDKSQIAADLEQIYDRFPRLKERRKQRAESLSGGEQQMLAVGRALMSRPKLLLMDEPSMGLSPSMVENVGMIIQAIHSTGIGILLVEQNAAMALTLAERAYVLELGEVVLEGSSRDVAGNEAVRRAYLGAVEPV
jgi:branched-chain amino acid transport system ATP-binding protein